MQVGPFELLQLKYINKILFMAQLDWAILYGSIEHSFHSVLSFPSTFLPTQTRNAD